MKIPYKDNLPVVKIRIIGKTSRELEAHIDFAASKTIIPPSLAEELELRLAGFAKIATGAGIISVSEYVAVVEAFEKRHMIHVGCLDLPEEISIRALIGRDILDRYKVCLNGKKKEVEISDP